MSVSNDHVRVRNMEQKNLNVSVNEGDAFFCHELSINYNPLQFVFDFKSITPRIDVRSKQGPVISIKHNVVMLDPYHAKKMLELFAKVVNDYEKDFGKITKPKAIEKMEKKLAEKGEDVAKAIVPTYFG
jgi:CRISPR/Cas system-associated endonuclease Cas3-HD